MRNDTVRTVLSAYPKTTAKLTRMGLIKPVEQAFAMMADAADNDKLPPHVQESLKNEPYRAMHRIMSIIALREGDMAQFTKGGSDLTDDQLTALQACFDHSSVAEFQRHIFLILADGLKLNGKVSQRLTDEQKASLPSDSVMWLADVLHKNPLAFKEFAALLTPVEMVKCQITASSFVHFRWAYLAENPPALTVDTVPHNAFDLFRFWLLNGCGFEASRKPGHHGEAIGATLDSNTFDFYYGFSQALTKAKDTATVHQSLDQLYLDTAKNITGHEFNTDAPTIARLVCMMRGFKIFTTEQLQSLSQEDIAALETLLPHSEQVATTKVTFLPKLIAAIQREHPDSSPRELLIITARFMQAMYRATADQSVIPLCLLADDSETCRQLVHLSKASRLTDKPLFHMKTSGRFTNLMPTTEGKAALEAAEQQYLAAKASCEFSIKASLTFLAATGLGFGAMIINAMRHGGTPARSVLHLPPTEACSILRTSRPPIPDDPKPPTSSRGLLIGLRKPTVASAAIEVASRLRLRR